jgi:hypothetical protein
MSKNQIIATWVAFVLTAMQNKYELFGNVFAEVVKKYKIIPFLINNYELLHYYDNDYITDDLEKYITEQGGSLDVV